MPLSDENCIIIAAHLRAIAAILIEPQTVTEPAAPPKHRQTAKKLAPKRAQTPIEAFEDELARNIAGGRSTVLQAKNRDDPQHEWATKCVGIALKHMTQPLPNGWPP